jgi:release factor glutamine methyltransferase
MTITVTAAALLAEGSRQLAGAGASGTDPRFDAAVLLAYALGIPRVRLSSHPELAVEAPAAAHYRRLLLRRAGGEPVAYLTGQREFWSLQLTVTPAVLVPRPETELLVERALALGPAAAARVADLGTGSGAVALALASERPAWQVIATDVSVEALAVARANAAALGLRRVDFRRGDWYAALQGESLDLIASNPPYVAADDAALLTLQHEPRRALTPATTRSPACEPWCGEHRSICGPRAGCCWNTVSPRPPPCEPSLSLLAFVTYARTAISPDTSASRKDNDDQIRDLTWWLHGRAVPQGSAGYGGELPALCR